MGLYLIAEVSWDYILQILWMIFSVGVGLGLVIFVHELGHFLVAKMCGVKCEKFYLGFDIPISLGPIHLPSRFCRFQWGETEYGVGILPLGGYVKMLGQDDNPAHAQQEAERIRVRKTTANDDEAPNGPPEPAATEAPTDTGPQTSPSGREDTSAAGDDDAEFQLDPRSYPAKPVLSRMAIISAGVIMNLIFAVLFATFAFGFGVPYQPCEVRGTAPGSPAWRAGLEPKSHIIQLGEKGRVSDHLRFDWDLRNAVYMAGEKEDVAVLIRKPDGSEQRLSLRPMVKVVDGDEIPMLGIEPARTTRLSKKLPTMVGFPASNAEPELLGGDRIVAVNGESVRITGVNGESKYDSYHLTRLLAGQISDTLSLTVERNSDEEDADSATPRTIQVKVAPNHVKRLGLVMAALPINGIRPGSPAEKAGFQLGDSLQSINGQALEDPMSLPDRLRPYYGQEIPIVVQRKGEDGKVEATTLRVTPETPTSYENVFSWGSPMAAKSLGIVFPIAPRIDGVKPGSPADQAGLKVGDEIVSVAFVSDDPEQEASELIHEGKPIELDDHTYTWPFFYDLIQFIEPEIRVAITYRRGQETAEATLAPVATDEFYADRGFVFTAKSETRYASTAREAIVLGFRRTTEDLTRVLAFLKKLRPHTFKDLGGPITIARVAGAEASQGVPRLLMFLTFLSANLAVLNFLPIPALDGGHMVFLLAEGVRGKPVDERMQVALTLAGVACLLGLMLFVIALDIGRLF